jgi:hypothetical protein
MTKENTESEKDRRLFEIGAGRTASSKILANHNAIYYYIKNAGRFIDADFILEKVSTFI